MQKTTDDLIVQLALTGLAKPAFDELAQVLRLTDFVKFAKYPASAEDDAHAFSVIRSSIEQIEKIPAIEGGAAT